MEGYARRYPLAWAGLKFKVLRHRAWLVVADVGTMIFHWAMDRAAGVWGRERGGI